MSTSSTSLWAALTRRKPVEAIEAEPGAATEEGGLTRSLGLWQLTAIGVGGIIGTGIFTLAGTVANQPPVPRSSSRSSSPASRARRPPSPTRSSRA